MGKNMIVIGALAGIAILGLAVFVAGQGGGTAGGSSSPAQVARGQALYAANCASCHGANLEGQPNWKVRLADGTLPAPPHDDSGHTWHHADDFLFGYTKFGGQAYAPQGFTSAMPGFEGKLSDADIQAVLAFIKSRWSSQSRAQQARISAQSR